MGQCLFDLFLRVSVIRQFAGEISFVGSHVDMTVPAVRQQDGLCLAGLLALEGFVNSCLYGMVGLRGADDALGAGEGYTGLKGAQLVTPLSRHGTNHLPPPQAGAG